MPLQPSDFALASRLLDQAMDLAPAEAQAWLDALAPENAHLREALRGMLAARASETHDRFLQSGPSLRDDERTDGMAEGDRVGPYRLIREIGRGGMGLVWLAERADGNFERQIALKLPRLAWMEGLAARMARERRIGALLEHPHIARMYDAGVDEQGRPFIAMAYIDGQPIDAWCREHQPTVFALLRLYLQVLQAVAYAHGRLVIHRDLKPANVLVDAQSQTHLLDFGIAKLLDDVNANGQALTQEQGRAMTLAYAAPEQLAGEPAGVTADVYSLGVLLYELLTGSLPFTTRGQGSAALEAAVMEGDAPPASTKVHDRSRRRRIQGEIDAIVGKAMKRHPQDRYPTADAFAQDIERHLRGDTVGARPDSVAYRLRKAFVRHKWGIGASAAVVVVALVGGGAAAWQGYKAAREAQRARAVTDLVADLLQASSRPAPSGSSEGAVLDQSAKLIEARFPAQPDLQAELYGVVSRVYADIGANKLAMDYAGRQLAALDQLPPDVPRRVRALLLLADTAMTEGRIKEAETQVRQAIAQAGSNLLLAAEGHALAARVEIQQGRWDEAKSSAALAEAQLLAPNAPLTVAAAWVLEAQASLLSLENRFDASIPVFDRAVHMARQAEGETSRTAIRMQADRARKLIDRDRYPEAKQQFDAAMARVRPGSGLTDEFLAALLAARFWTRAYEMSLVSYDETAFALEPVRAGLSRHGANVPELVRAEVNFLWSRVRFTHGDLAGAQVLLSSSLPELKRGTDRLGSHFAFAVSESQIYMYLGEHDRAEQLLKEVIQLRTRMGSARAPYTAANWATIALNKLMRGDAGGAVALIRSAPAFGVDNATGFNYGGYLKAIFALALLENGDVEEAVQAMPVQMRAVEDDNVEFPTSAYFGEILCAARRPREGLQLLQASMRQFLSWTGSQHPMLARMHAVAGLCALAVGDRRQATRFAELARLGIAAHPRLSPWFERPLLRLEQALQRKPAAARGSSVTLRRTARPPQSSGAA